jgi:hypothetical protein
MFIGEITQTGTRAGMVETETPHGRVQMQADERIGPRRDAV